MTCCGCRSTQDQRGNRRWFRENLQQREGALYLNTNVLVYLIDSKW